MHKFRHKKTKVSNFNISKRKKDFAIIQPQDTLHFESTKYNLFFSIKLCFLQRVIKKLFNKLKPNFYKNLKKLKENYASRGPVCPSFFTDNFYTIHQ